jgi:ribonuclease P protein component
VTIRAPEHVPGRAGQRRPLDQAVARRRLREATVPTEQPEAGEAPRLPSPDVDPGRSGRPQGAAAEGPPQALGLSRDPEPDGCEGRTTWRIRDAATFAALRASRDRVRAGPLSITRVPPGSASDTGAAVAYAIGKRVGTAVVRNRLRRRLRAVLAAASLPPGAYLVAVRPDAADLSFDDLKALVSHALQALPSSPRRSP